MVFGKEVMVADPKSSGIMGMMGPMGPMGDGGGGAVPVRQPNYVTNLYRRVFTDCNPPPHIHNPPPPHI